MKSDSPCGGESHDVSSRLNASLRTLFLVALLLVSATAAPAVAYAEAAPPGDREVQISDTHANLSVTNASTDGRTTGSPTAGPGADRAGAANESAVTLTLITGQTVTVEKRRGETVYTTDAETAMRRISTPDGTYVFPENADLERFDPRLFNVDLLVEQNLTDANVDSIPVIVERRGSPDEVGRTDGNAERSPTAALRDDMGRTRGLTAERTLDSVDAVSASVSKDQSAAVYETLRTSAEIEHVSLDARVSVSLDDVSELTGAGAARSRYGVNGENVTVAVLDSGVDDSHPDLQDAVTRQVDFTGEGTTDDPYGHGTHTAGIVAGDGSASNGTYTGIAPNASVLNLRVIESDGYGSRSNVIDAIEYAVDETDADVISVSLGGPVYDEDPYFDAVQYAVDNGVTVVVAAGNDGRPGHDGYGTVLSPGVVPSALTVGASDGDDRLAPFSSRGPTATNRVKPDLVAPGVGIASARAGTDRYVEYSGTSMSAPAVSGIAALLLDANPDWTPTDVRSALVTRTDRLEGNYDIYQAGSGRVNATAALTANVTVAPSTVDFGVVRPSANETRVVELTNRGTETVTLDVSAHATDIDDGTTGDVSLNRTAVSVAPGDTEAVAVRVNGTTDAGVYSGRLLVDGGEYRGSFGYTIGHRLSVSKHGANGTNVAGDEVVLYRHGDGGSTEVLSLSGDDAETLVFEGTYTVVSGGVDESTGETVLVEETLTVSDDATVSFDENDAVRYGLNASGLGDGTELETLRAAGEMQRTTADGRSLTYESFRTFPDEPSVRFSTGTANASVSYLLAPASAYDDGGHHLDVSEAYHLVYPTVGVDGPRTVAPDESDLAAQTVTYGRTGSGDDYDVVRTVTHSAFPTRGLTTARWDRRDRTRQTVYVTPSGSDVRTAYGLTAVDNGGDWRFVSPMQSLAVGENRAVSVRAHPLTVDRRHWHLGATPAAANVSVGARFQVDQPPTRFVHRSSATNHYEIRRNGTTVAARTTTGDEFTYAGDDPLVENATYEAVLTANGSDGLSTRSITRYAATYRPGEDVTPPELRGIRVTDGGEGNSLYRLPVTLSLAASDDMDLANGSVRVRYADGSVTTAPHDGNVTNTSEAWHEAAVERTGNGEYAVELDGSRITASTLHLNVALVDASGNLAESTVYDAYRSTAPPTVTLEGTVRGPDGTAAADDVVTTHDGARRTNVSRTDADGSYAVGVRRNATVDVGYRQYDTTADEFFPEDGVADVYPLANTVTETDADLGTHDIPDGHPVTMTVTDESGAPVANASVAVDVSANGASVRVGEFLTTADGRLPVDGLELSGNVSVAVTPPENESFVPTTTERTVVATGPRDLTVTLEEPSLVAHATADPATATVGDAVTFDAADSAAQGAVVAYDWSFGDGATAKGEHVSHAYESPGEYEAALTLTDEYGVSATDTVTVSVEARPDNSSGNGSDGDGNDDGGGGDDGGDGDGNDGGGGEGNDGSDGGDNNDGDDSSGGGSGGAPSSGLEPSLGVGTDVTATADGATVTVVRGLRGDTASADLPASVTANGVGATGINVTLAENAPEFDLSVGASAEPPGDVPAYNRSTALGYFDVGRDSVSEEAIAEASLRFSVSQSALPDSADPDDVTLYRYHDGEWRDLPTNHTGNEYEAATPGFSAFAVGVEHPEYSVTDATLGATEVADGESVPVEATVTNTGTAGGNATVALERDSEVVAERTVSLAPGEARTVSFAPTLGPGTHDLNIGETDVGTVTVSDPSETESTGEPSTTTAEDRDAETESDGQPGVGPVGAVLALTLTLLGRRRFR
ncbi:S8 family serine peptidase [Halostella pelagica]|uniref:S8 family serine peptidase n=1 Tax=Halostella pelagica TaxID=2583824 RepID=UPI001080C1A9|nr:S8 family serine peptidase [Halostella pelagica]